MSPFHWLSKMYDRFSGHRTLLYTCTFSLILVSAIIAGTVRLDEDIKVMLPDDNSDVAIDFDLLQSAPFTKKVIINLRADPLTDRTLLFTTADRLADRMRDNFFSRVVTGPDTTRGKEFFTWMAKKMPCLFSGQDVDKVRIATASDEVRTRLQNLLDRLQTPESWVLKSLARVDPLGLTNIGFEKFQFLNMIPQMKLERNHFISRDGKNVC